MKTQKDSKGHVYADVDNTRVTYIPAKDREGSKDWAGSDVIRVQGVQAAAGSSLYTGPEFPVSSPEVFGQFVAGICQVYVEGREVG
jgi:hypothetical protein